MDLGLEAAGFETLVATDIDPHSCITLERNKKFAAEYGKSFLNRASVVEADVTQLSADDLLSRAGLRPGELDLLAGGPPCQAFSVFGKRKGLSDPRGRLVDDYLRILVGIKPKAFVFENVYGLLTVEGGSIFEELVKKLEHPDSTLKYDVRIHRLLAQDYGVPQHRDRIFIVGSRIGSSVTHIPPICSAAQSSNLMPPRTVAQALKGLPSIGYPGSHNHVGRNHSERIVERYQSLKHGERDPKTRINRLDPTRPSYTIIVGSDAGGGKGHVHPVEPREVTPRESARMQCFPDWYWFSGTSRHPIRQIGNAVPTMLAAAVGKAILEEIFNSPSRPYSEIISELNQEHLFSAEDLKFLINFDRDDQRSFALAI